MWVYMKEKPTRTPGFAVLQPVRAVRTATFVARKKGFVEIVPNGLDKSKLVDHVLTTVSKRRGGAVDFILCIGDDSADEFMFQALHARFADRPAGTVPALFTCVVGRKPSSAQYLSLIHI